jgi:4-hydroxy-tetrahydrodipicolinate reductase
MTAATSMRIADARVSTLKLAIVGANGKMGRAVVRLAHDLEGAEIVCAIGNADMGVDAGELAGVRRIGVAVTSHLAALASCGADVVIDFSSPVLSASLAQHAAHAKIAIVSGTTGLDDAATAAFDHASESVAVLWEPNMSVGVHVLGDLVRRAITALGPAFDIEIVEAHHDQKLDAPSGTALRLAKVAQAARADVTRLVHGRESRAQSGSIAPANAPQTGPMARQSGEIGMHSMRGGDVVGDHTVHLLGDGERLELTHRATSRDVFAHGALRAARWIAARPAGRYALVDVLGE